MKFPRSKIGKAAFAAAAAVIVLIAASGIWYKVRAEKICEGCHEIRPSVDSWRTSTHRAVGCTGCHDGPFSLDPAVHVGNLASLVNHVRGIEPEQILITEAIGDRLLARCRSCHAQEWADWEAGPHGKDLATFVLDEAQNRGKLLMDDCLRCHGMHFQGGIGDLVGPLDSKGPWKLVRPDAGARPAIPCTACHEVHAPGEPLGRPPAGSGAVARAADAPPAAGPAAGEEIHRPSLAFFDRRAQAPIAVARLPLPEVRDGERKVAMSPDRRQALCYQCHGPDATGALGSGSDRTPAGVHEGLSCLACHAKHGQRTRASCAGCHPRLSNCGLDVEAMDTTFKSLDSQHDIHTVKCADCHPAGVPAKKK